MNSQSAVPSKLPCPPPNSKNVGVQHYTTASILVKSPIASDPVAPSRGFSSVFIKPQPAKFITQIQAEAKCTPIRLMSDPKSDPPFLFVDAVKSLGADSLESSDGSTNNSSSISPINLERAVSFYDPRKKKVLGCISLEKVN